MSPLKRSPMALTAVKSLWPGLHRSAASHQADCVIGVGGGKALDTAKLLAHQLGQPVITIPTSGATCAAWTALSNVYSEDGAFLYDVALPRCPDLLIFRLRPGSHLCPPVPLVAGIGDGLAKWYEASVSSGYLRANPGYCCGAAGSGAAGYSLSKVGGGSGRLGWR